METIKILNLYACLGGNRYKWNEISENIHVTAVELDKSLCDLYSQRFPNDTVINEDAHEFLLKHFKEFDFIWSSPPCPTHSQMRNLKNNCDETVKRYPDMKLYEEIIYLSHFYDGFFCVENVIAYYEPLIIAHKRGRHLYWTNFNLPNDLNDRRFAISQAKDELKQEFITIKKKLAPVISFLAGIVDAINKFEPPPKIKISLSAASIIALIISASV